MRISFRNFCQDKIEYAHIARVRQCKDSVEVFVKKKTERKISVMPVTLVT